MKAKFLFLGATLVCALQFNSFAQTNVPADAPEHVNKAVVPVPRTGGITNRQNQVLQRAKAATGEYDIEFIGDSITQGWETAGKNVWDELGAKYRIINFGVSGDRTENVL